MKGVINMTITEQIIKCAMLKGMTQRNFPMFNLLNAAREDQQITQGMAVVMTDAYGQRVLMPGPNAQATQPAAIPADVPTVAQAETFTKAEVTGMLDQLKHEIYKTQGRALQKEIGNVKAQFPVKEETVEVTDET
jgi:hypothetical protein